MMTRVWCDLPCFQSCHLAPLYQGRVHPPPSCLSHPSHRLPNKKVPSLLSWDHRVHLHLSVPPQEETASEVTAVMELLCFCVWCSCMIFKRVFLYFQQWPASWFPRCRGQSFPQAPLPESHCDRRRRLLGEHFRSSQSCLISLMRKQTFKSLQDVGMSFPSGWSFFRGLQPNKYQKEVEFLHETEGFLVMSQ